MFKTAIAALSTVVSAVEPITHNLKVARTTAAINARTDALIALGAELDAKHAAQTATATN